MKLLYFIILNFPILSAFAVVSTQKPFTVRGLYQPLSLEEERRFIPITLITRGDIKNCIGCDFTDILERAGVPVQRFNAQFSESSDTDRAYVSFRGVTNTQVTLLVDGVRQEDSTISHPLWSSIPVHHIEKIEIIRGPMGLGDSNIGGAINVVTQKAMDCSSENLCVNAVTEVSNKLNTGKTAYMGVHFHSLDKGTGFRMGFQGDRRGDPEGMTGNYSERAFSANLDHKIGRWLVEGSAFIYDSYSNSDPTPFVESRDSHISSLGTTYYISPEQLFRVRFGYDKEQQSLTGSSIGFVSRSLSIQMETVYHFNFWDGGYTLTAGVEGRRDRVDSAPRDEYEYKQRDTQSAFTGLTGSHGPFQYRVTVRTDRLDREMEEQILTWSGAASYHIAEIVDHNVSIRNRVSTGFRDPGFNERYVSFGNPNAKIEKSITHEIGFRIERKEGSYFLDATAFGTEIDTNNENVEREAYIHGIEMQAGVVLGDWDSRASYTNINTDNTEQLRAYEPIAHLGSIRVSHTLNPDWTVGTEMTYKKWEDPSFVEESSVWDVFLYRNVSEGLRLGLAVRNVDDEEYNQGVNTQGPGRTVHAELDFRF